MGYSAVGLSLLTGLENLGSRRVSQSALRKQRYIHRVLEVACQDIFTRKVWHLRACAQ